MQIAFLSTSLDLGPRAHVTALAGGLRRRGADVRLLELPLEPREDDEALRAARGAACVIACAGAGGLHPLVERHMLALRRDGHVIARLETTPESTAELAAERPDRGIL